MKREKAQKEAEKNNKGRREEAIERKIWKPKWKTMNLILGRNEQNKVKDNLKSEKDHSWYRMNLLDPAILY